jgi:two-component system, OmpR family, sensor histidine kinase KdpD
MSEPRQNEWREYVLILSVLAAITGGGLLAPPHYSLSVGLLYLLALILLSLRVGRWPMLLGGLISAMTWEYVFLEPRFTFRLASVQDELLVAIYLILALVVGQLTDRIRSQARKEKTREESERLHRTLLDSVSHELRTPLAVITAGLENLSASPPEARDGVVAEIRIAARRLNRLVGNLLDQTRLESGTLRPRLDWCDARDLINAASEGLRDALASHSFSVSVPEDMPPIRADFALTEHALANLLLNAALHTPPGTAIAASAGISPDGRQAYFTVADRGPGMPIELRARLFQKFTRGNAARAGGLGLGLSIARGFLAAQGGDLFVDENPGGGAVFTIYLHHSTPQPDPLE